MRDRGGENRWSIQTDIPARLDRLPWSRFHWLVVVALGITWVLDGLEVSVASAIAGVVALPTTLGLSPTAIGATATFYLAGAVVGALGFGWLTDRFGRKRLFFVTLVVYMFGNALTAFAWGFVSLACFRVITGLGIGGEYAAINSAIDELIPARLRGRVDLAVNGTYWLGAAAGVGAELLLLDPRILPHWLGWRVGFGIGPLLGALVLFARRHLPESPRWLVVHGRADEASRIVEGLERQASERPGRAHPPPRPIKLTPRRAIGFLEIARAILRHNLRRTVLALGLMIAQSFLYNAIYFTYAIVLTTYYGVEPTRVPLYLLPFAGANFLGPLVLGPLFDTVGRKPMIAITFGASGALLLIFGGLFAAGALSAAWMTVAWTIVFFVASPAASAAYLTTSEIFPLETRAMAIALFYAVGVAAGGVLSPLLFGALIGTGSRMALFYGYALGSGLMMAAAVLELAIGVRAERRSLEEIAAPLTASADGAD